MIFVAIPNSYSIHTNWIIFAEKETRTPAPSLKQMPTYI